MRDFKPMTLFDKICAVLSIVIGAIFMLAGVLGLFTGARAHFSLPPILGVLPFFLGWGMCVPLVKYWAMSNRARQYDEYADTEREGMNENSFE